MKGQNKAKEMMLENTSPPYKEQHPLMQKGVSQDFVQRTEMPLRIAK